MACSYNKAGSYQANRAMDDMSVIFNFAIEEKIIKENICEFSKSELNEESYRLDDIDPYTLEEWRLLERLH